MAFLAMCAEEVLGVHPDVFRLKTGFAAARYLRKKMAEARPSCWVLFQIESKVIRNMVSKAISSRNLKHINDNHMVLDWCTIVLVASGAGQLKKVPRMFSAVGAFVPQIDICGFWFHYWTGRSLRIQSTKQLLYESDRLSLIMCFVPAYQTTKPELVAHQVAAPAGHFGSNRGGRDSPRPLCPRGQVLRCDASSH